MKNSQNKVTLYFLAGVATSENFLDDFKYELVKRYEQAGTEVHAFLLYPYGNWNRRLWKQVMEISYDLLPRFSWNSSYMRAQSVVDYIKETHHGGEIVIIGHSSGGVAGVQAANLLNRTLFTEVRVIQIGSPKCPISERNREATLYIRAVNRNGKLADPITRLGSWAGWEKNKLKFQWKLGLKAPAHIHNIPIIGGHADYFRNQAYFVDEAGKSNLAITMDNLWKWLVVDESK